MEYDVWVFADAYGCIGQFEPYQGVKKGKQVASSTKLGLGEKVVLGLTECFPSTVSYHIFKDDYLTFFCLITHLGVTKIRATGVLNKNRFHKCTGDK